MISLNQNAKVKSQNFNPKFKTDLNLRCYQLSLDVINLIHEAKNSTATRVLGDQVLRSATSIGANLVEARAASSRLEFKKFHEISLKSANETKYWLCLLRDANLVEKSRANNLLNEVEQIANMLASSVLKLKNLK